MKYSEYQLKATINLLISSLMLIIHFWLNFCLLRPYTDVINIWKYLEALSNLAQNAERALENYKRALSLLLGFSVSDISII